MAKNKKRDRKRDLFSFNFPSLFNFGLRKEQMDLHNDGYIMIEE